MKSSLTYSLLVLLGASLLALPTTPVASAAETVVKFSDPSKPGRLVVQVGMGDVTIVGQDATEVRISSDDEAIADAKPKPRDDGMRRLDGDGGFSTSESDNVITVTFSNVLMHGRRHRGGNDSDVAIAVPRQTSITLERIGPGDLVVRDLAGDVEVRGAMGDIELQQISGGVVVESVNGDVDATFAALAPDRPVSINVVNGDVEMRVPANARANVSLRTLRGEMLTNFSEAELKTNYKPQGNLEDDSDVVSDQAQADHDRGMAEREQAVAQREQALAEARKYAAGGGHGMPPIPPLPPIPPMPPMAGGKLVAGTLNGGGTNVTVTTIMGDIRLRKVE